MDEPFLGNDSIKRMKHNELYKIYESKYKKLNQFTNLLKCSE